MLGDIFIAALGLSFGSFLNVCIYRLPRAQSVLRPASRCAGCGQPLGWIENIPVVSYLALRGRCRRCGGRISPMYPIVELSTMGVWLYFYARVGWQPLLVSRLAFASALIALFAIDLGHRILPNVITLPGTVAGLLFSVLGIGPRWVDSLLGIVLGGGGLFLIAEIYYRVRGEEGLGMGDVKMMAMIGAFLGWKLMLLTLVLGSFMGSLTGGVIVLFRLGGLKYALPFGTFLAVGALVAVAVGDPILQWYFSFYQPR